MKKKIFAIGLVLAIALSALGVGYALWSDTLTINGTVNTGNVDVGWSSDVVGYDSEPTEKDVSSITAPVDSLTWDLVVELWNAYPCIDYYVDVDVHNWGTVPVILTGLTFNAPAGVHVCVLPASFGGYEGYPDIAEGTQLEGWGVGDVVDYIAMGTLHVHLDNTVAQSSQITFTGEISGVQYNEY